MTESCVYVCYVCIYVCVCVCVCLQVKGTVSCLVSAGILDGRTYVSWQRPKVCGRWPRNIFHGRIYILSNCLLQEVWREWMCVIKYLW